jgi:hypothetical protein
MTKVVRRYCEWRKQVPRLRKSKSGFGKSISGECNRFNIAAQLLDTQSRKTFRSIGTPSCNTQHCIVSNAE